LKNVQQQQKEIETALEAIKSVQPANFKISLDDKGTITERSFSYEYGENDMKLMASMVSNLDKTISEKYRTEKGFNHAQFGEDLLWLDKNFRGKAIEGLIQKAIAQDREETLKSYGNHNFGGNKPIDSQQREGVTVVPISDITSKWQ
jgi:hypothetical protein